ncbi:accessory gland protein Acp62F [Drosophila subpulchrella]|uniref:accessory gland protein Acp62F n=1 Tax=Drosophila subpulchrella TaxID=1486046 RepID=UPI0018A132F0|nr:accessory gland protein Acp62F [Drosophila subpulchrella]
MWKWEIFALVGLIICSVTNCTVEKIDCTENGTQADCPTYCPETCEYKGKSKCLLICGGPCVCKPGYVINRDIPACVLRSDCPHHIVQGPGGRRISNFDCFSGINSCSQLNI